MGAVMRKPEVPKFDLAKAYLDLQKMRAQVARAEIEIAGIPKIVVAKEARDKAALHPRPKR
jgi:hypothetical protein